LIVDPDGVLPFSVALQSFKPVSGRNTKVLQPSCLIEQSQFDQSFVLHLRRQLPASDAEPDLFSLPFGEAQDHASL
jgi:hypothetical protein